MKQRPGRAGAILNAVPSSEDLGVGREPKEAHPVFDRVLVIWASNHSSKSKTMNEYLTTEAGELPALKRHNKK